MKDTLLSLLNFMCYVYTVDVLWGITTACLTSLFKRDPCGLSTAYSGQLLVYKCDIALQFMRTVIWETGNSFV